MDILRGFSDVSPAFTDDFDYAAHCSAMIIGHDDSRWNDPIPPEMPEEAESPEESDDSPKYLLQWTNNRNLCARHYTVAY